MKNSRRGRIIELLNSRKTDQEILQILNKEFPVGMFSTTNQKALYGTKWDLGIAGPIVRDTPKTVPVKTVSINVERDRNQLIRVLKEFQIEPVIARYIQKDLRPEKAMRQLLDFTFGSSIYRAFRHETPTQRFKEWRWYRNSDELKKRVLKVNNQETHDLLLNAMAKSLVEDWDSLTDRSQPTRMSIGIALKITNLILKHFYFSSTESDRTRIEWLHVPWDKYTLLPLKDIWLGSPRIPSTASQGFVTTLEQYWQLHSLITDITMAAGVPRIYYEFWAWDKEH